VIAAGGSSSRLNVGAEGDASWGQLAAGSIVHEGQVDLRGRSVLLAVISQFTAAAALMQLDGLARRIVLFPPDMSRDHLAYAAATAEADLILTDDPTVEAIDASVRCVRCAWQGGARSLDKTQIETEWILLTSGTTGVPKLVVHTLATLCGAIQPSAIQPGASSPVWATFYDIRRYGGMQIFLRAVLGGTTLVLKSAKEPVTDFLARAGSLGVTHILGTPSHWRGALMSNATGKIAPRYVRLSGEISDQAILNQMRAAYPDAAVVHAFASTEAGVVFEVKDGLTGFPPDVVGSNPQVEVNLDGGTLKIRSARTAFRYLGANAPVLKNADGFVDTGDAVELRDGRYCFVGRQDGTINVGGMKVHPEEVEAVINRHPDVSVSLVRMKKNSIIGGLVVADVVLKTQPQPANSNVSLLQREILQFCRGELAQHKVPAAINFVPGLAVAESGKLIRPHA
jgi:acyl-coenzyme A synthetase/AMP-(fatty) acid ligase